MNINNIIFFKNKKAQYYLFTAIILIVYAMLVLKPKQEISKPNDVLEELKQNFDQESVYVVNNALVEGKNITNEYKLFAEQFIYFAGLKNVQLELFYILINDNEKFIVNKMNNDIILEQLNYIMNSDEIITTTNETLNNYTSIKLENDETGTFRYLFNINTEPHQLKYLMRAKKGDNIQVFKN